MEIQKDLPIPAYYKLCDNIEKRINKIQYLNGGYKPLSNKKIEELNKLRNKLIEIKQILEMDNLGKINEDIEKLREVVLERMEK